MSDVNNAPNRYNEKGRQGFLPGNPGRPKGAVRRASSAALAIVHANATAITTTIITKAIAGESWACQICANQIFPKSRVVEVDASSTDDLFDQLRNGELSADEAKTLIGALVQQQASDRIAAMEEELLELRRKMSQ